MVRIDTEQMISVSEAAKLGVSRLLRDAEEGRGRVVLRNNRPIAAVVGMAEIEELADLRAFHDDFADVALATARMLTDSGERIGLDQLLDEFGYTREQLRTLDEEHGR